MPVPVRMNKSSFSTLRSCETCIDTAASVTPSSWAAPLTEPWRTTLEKALNCAGDTAVKIPSSHVDDKTDGDASNALCAELVHMRPTGRMPQWFRIRDG